MNSLSASLIALMLILIGSSVSACELATPLFDFNRRVHQSTDGSIKGGGEFDNVAGMAAFDLGGGRIGQVISTGGACQYFENLLLADCSSMQMTVVGYLPKELRDHNDILQGSFPVDALLPPDGLISKVKNQNIRAMRKFLIQQGAEDRNGLLQSNAKEKPRDQFNPLAGCDAFYPASRGAAYEWPKI